MKNTQKLVLSAMLLAAGLVLPFLTGQIPEIGKMLLPMHLPVMLCGLICGWQYGAGIGFVMPLLRSLLFGMPVIYPNAVAMAFELCAYGFTVGLLYAQMKKKTVLTVYLSLIPAMLFGRIVWGIAEVILLGLSGQSFAFAAFWAGAFATALPGIILQLILIPAIMLTLQKLLPKVFS